MDEEQLRSERRREAEEQLSQLSDVDTPDELLQDFNEDDSDLEDDLIPDDMELEPNPLDAEAVEPARGEGVEEEGE